ncbi:hypothetical protein [Fictibacillus enclensis]|uniref:hypothetical protein n=1 Tax=Fictibacillus enclensis TaxID=1017270 RepID=UPI0024C02EF8|nr:hypothetical protein [Fictibacillus enclensis]WHY74597.1 hypothetical protein QNH15_12105 [Fictibacillus enclensis]
MMEAGWLTVTLQGVWGWIKDWSVFIVPVLAFFFARLGSNWDKKLEYRTFLDVGTIVHNYRLKGCPTLKTGSKMITPKQFATLEEGLLDNTLPPVPITYLQIKPFGKSIITSCRVKVVLKEAKNGTQIWLLDISLPILNKEEEVYIPLDSLEMKGSGYFVRHVKIDYETQVGEKFQFIQNTFKVNEESHFYETTRVRKFIFLKSIQSKGDKAGYVTLTNDKDYPQKA